MPKGYWIVRVDMFLRVGRFARIRIRGRIRVMLDKELPAKIRML